ncbi:SPTN4 protein, partial [Psilopogon haemacephalus]|nr:SPTN4 protein [Psilopogon haemacephalus]
LLVSKDLGKHLLEVEDLLQQQSLLEADISAQAERVQALNIAALKFSELEGEGRTPGGGGWGGDGGFLTPPGGLSPPSSSASPLPPSSLPHPLEELQGLAASRRRDLEASRQLWALLEELEEAESWMREQEQLLLASSSSSSSSSSSLGELGGGRKAQLQRALQRAERLQQAAAAGGAGCGGGSSVAGRLRRRLREVRQRWKGLEELRGQRQRSLRRGQALRQLQAEAQELGAWLQDLYRLASSDDFGHDDHSSLALLRRHQSLLQQLEKQRGALTGLREQVASVSASFSSTPTLSASPGAGLQGQEAVVEVQVRVVEVEQLFGEVVEVALLRQQWLQDALAVYQMFGQVHACEVWLEEKEQWLQAMELPQQLDEAEVVQHRFESLDQEMNSVMGRILDVNQEVQQLLDGGHPSSEEVRACQDHLNSR